MAQQKWRNRLTQHHDADVLISQIKDKLQRHYLDRAITYEQLNKLLTLASNTAQLQHALTWLS